MVPTVNSLWSQSQQYIRSLMRGVRKRRLRERDLRHLTYIEWLEDRTLLSGATGDESLGPVGFVYGPDTPQDYVDLLETNQPGAADGLSPFNLTSRWSATATNGGGLSQGDPTTVTWSIVDDGTPIPALGGIGGESSAPSNLVAFLGGIYGVNTPDTNYMDEPWFGHFVSMFSRWSEVSGLNYVYEPNDDGAAFSNFSSAAPGVLGVRADARIGGHALDGNSGVLAYNFFPQNGEMVIDTNDSFYSNTSQNSIRLRNVLTHEVGHGIGILHSDSNDSEFLMEPFYNPNFDGPQFDDILAAQRHYGDANGNNDTPATAVDLGTISFGQEVSVGTDAEDMRVEPGESDFVSIDSSTERDVYAFTVTDGSDLRIRLTPQGPTYLSGPQNGTQTTFAAHAQNDLTLELIDKDGTTVLEAANANGLGNGEVIFTSVATAGEYYVRVSGAQNAAQMYRLDVYAKPIDGFVPFQSVSPNGGLVTTSQQNFSQLASGAAQRDFNLYLYGGQFLSAIVTPTENVTVSVELVGETGAFASPAPGESAVFPLTSVFTSGTYTFRVTSSGPTEFEVYAAKDTDLTDVATDTADGSEANITPTGLFLGSSGRFAAIGTANATPTTNLRFVHTNDPGAFIDITGSSPVSLGDSSTLSVSTSIGNAIFPAGSYSINSNGGIISGTSQFLFNTNDPLPTTDISSFSRALIPFWDDLTNVTAYRQETTINGIPALIIQWDGEHKSTANRAVFQVQLFDDGPVFARFAYQDVDFGDPGLNGGASATIGYQESSTTALQFSRNATTVTNGDVLDLQYAFAPDVDEYEINLNGRSGEEVDVVLSGLNGADFSGELLELIAPDGSTVLATGVSDPLGSDAENFDLGILGFVVPTDGVYTIRVSATLADAKYSLGVGAAMTFDAEPNSTITGPLRNVRSSGVAIGRLDVVTDTTDYVALDLNVGDRVNLRTYTPYDNPNSQPVDTLDPELQVLHPDQSTVVVTDLNSAPDGKNAEAFFIASVTGTYYVRTSATSGAGEYTMTADVIPADAPDPLVGIDFGTGGSPNNWSSFAGTADSTINNLIDENGAATVFDVDINVDTSAGSYFGYNPPASQLPMHAQSLANINGVYSDVGNIELTFSELNAGEDYEFYIFGGDSIATNQTITITGANVVSFNQSRGANELYVNGELGDSGRSLSSYAEVVTADASGEILVRIQGGPPGFSVAGVAFRSAAPPAPGVSITESGGNTVVSETGTTDTFEVVLDAQPTSDVVLTLNASDLSEATIDKATLTFTTANWNTPQVVTVTGQNDSFVDGNIGSTVTVSVDDANSDDAYDDVDDQTVAVVTLDDESAGFTVTELGSVLESGTTDSFTVVLNDQPQSDVVILVQNGDPSEVSLDKTMLTFTPSNWDSPQTVTVTGVDDLNDDGDQTTSITLSIDDVNSDDFFDGLADQTNTVITVDDDTAGFTIVETGGTTSVDESGTTDTFTVVLNAQPLTDVVLFIQNPDTGEASLDKTSLTFTPANWDTPQTVTVTGVDELNDDGDQTTNLTVTVDDANSDDVFDPLADQSILVTTVDNDTAGFTIVETGGGTIVNESGTTDTFTVVLNAQPLSDVVLLIQNPDAGEASLDKTSLTFTPANWDTPQTVTVTGVDEFIDDGDQVTTLNLTVDDANSDDAFDPLADQTVAVTTVDNDTAGFTFVETGGSSSVDESGTTDTFTVVLNAQPATDVVLLIQNPDTGEASLDKTSLTFTPANWDTPQTVTVTGVDEFVDDGDQVTNLTITVDDANSDDVFDPLADQTVVVTTVDNDTAGFTIVESDGNTTVEESGTTDTFTVVLTSQPLSNVVFTVNNADSSEIVVDTLTLTFTALNWDTPQTVTVTGLDDALDDNDQVTAVTLSIEDANSSDEFDAIPDQVVSVTTLDDDGPGVTVDPTGLVDVSEDGTSTTFTVVLDLAPTTDVVLNVTSDDTTETTVDKATLNFTSSDWNIPQTVTITGVDDPTLDGDQLSTITIAVDAANSDDAYDGVNDKTLSLTTSDNDVAGFTVVETGGSTSVDESGTTDTFTVVLNAQPLTDVVLLIQNPDTGEASLDKTSLTFTPANWDTPQTVTVTGVDETLVDGDINSTITVTIDAADSDDGFDGLAAQTVSVTTTDNDVAGFTVSESVDTVVSESGTTDTFTVVLNAAPLTDVVFNLSSSDLGEAVLDRATLTFTTANWDTPQTVTVTGVDDALVDGDIVSTTTISVDGLSSDPAFASLSDQTVSVTTTDDDIAVYVNGTGDLVISDPTGSRDDNLTIVVDGANLRISDPDNLLSAGVGASLDGNDVLVPLSSITGGIIVNTLDGNDRLTLDYSGDGTLGGLSITYDGGGESGSGDSLTLNGGTFVDSTYNFDNEHDGTIQLTGAGMITYTGLEPITSSITATNVTLNYSTSTETITVSDAGGGQTTVDSDVAGEVVTFNNPTGLLTLNGGDGGVNTINVNDLAPAYPASIEINGGVQGDVNLNGALLFAADASLTVNARQLIADGATVETTGTGSVTWTTIENIWIRNSTQLSTVDGGIAMNAHLSGLVSRGFVGVSISNSLIQTSGIGEISIAGVGGNDPVVQPMVGVDVGFGSIIRSTAATPNAGGIQLTGTGGNGPAVNQGVGVRGAGTAITTVNGDISIVGHGTGTGSSDNGVMIVLIDQIASTGVGPDAGTITIVGSSGAGGTSSNNGVLIRGASTKINSVDGDIDISGIGGNGSGNENNGIVIEDIDSISSTGVGADAATITITGNGGSGFAFHKGVSIRGTTTDISSVDGDIFISGVGGTGTDASNPGLLIDNIQGIFSTGTGTEAAGIHLDGMGGIGDGNDAGVIIIGANTVITTIDGDILMTGQGGDGNGTNNVGVRLNGPDEISSTGVGPDAGTITIIGTGGAAEHQGAGVYVNGSITTITSVDGDITIDGTGGGDGTDTNQYGFLMSFATISSTGTGADAANINITGMGGTGSSLGHGIVMTSSSTIRSEVGQINLMGTGSSTTPLSSGIVIGNNSTVRTTDGSIQLMGTASVANSHGVHLTGIGGGHILSDASGTITIEAIGNGVDADLQIDTTSTIGGVSANGEITLKVDSIDLTSSPNLESTGPLTIQPHTASQPITIGAGAPDIGLHLSQAELDLLASSFSSITIGDVVNGTGDVQIYPTTLNVPVTIAGGFIHDQAGTDLSAPAVRLVGTVSPGQSPGVLVVDGDLTFDANSTYSVELVGPAAGGPGVSFDQIDAAGTVTIDPGATLDLLTAIPIGPIGTTIVILNNDGTDAVAGTFAGLPEGGTVNFTGIEFIVSYTGGTGNDITLTQNTNPYFVDTLDETIDGDLSTGNVSLREAVEFANLTGGADITFSPALARGTIALTSRIDITTDITIIGLPHDQLTISGMGSTQLFHVAAGLSVEFSNLNFIDGMADGGTSDSDNGGAIYIGDGAFANFSTVTFANNSAFGDGGAIYNAGQVTLVNATLSGNSAGNLGGAIYSDLGADLQVTHGTLVDNFASNDGGGIFAFDDFSTTTNLVNSILAGNNNGLGPNEFAGRSVLPSSANNLFGDPNSSGGILNGVNQNILGDGSGGLLPVTQIVELELRDNGGPALTHNLLIDSAAIDAGRDSISQDAAGNPLLVDQTGVSRRQRAHVDMGAVELPDSASVNAYDGTSGDFTVATSDTSVFSFATGPNWNPADGWKLFSGDFNGDGIQDVAGYRTSGLHAGRWQIGLSNGDSLETHNTVRWDAAAGWVDFQVGDYNGDGQDDVAARNSSGQWWVARSTGTGFVSRPYARWNPTGWIGTVTGDFNMDGADDIAGLHASGQWWIGLSTGTRLITRFMGQWESQAVAGWSNIFAGDFNGDGQADVLGQRTDGQWQYGVTTGAPLPGALGGQRLNSYAGNTWSTTDGFDEFLLGDFDGDGRDDIASRNNAGDWWVLRSLGNTAVTEFWGRWGTTQDWSAVVIDFDGDGRDDIVGFDANISAWYVSGSQYDHFQMKFVGKSLELTDPEFLGER